MKTTRTFFLLAMVLGMFVNQTNAKEPYFFEDFENFVGVAHQGIFPANDNIFFNQKLNPEFSYPFRIFTEKLIPFYGTGGTEPKLISGTHCWYSNERKIQADAWMITRQIDLTTAENPELWFQYACLLYVSNRDFSVKITEAFDGVNPNASTWVDMTEISGLNDIMPYGAGKWATRLADIKIDLTAYKGKKIYVGFNAKTPFDDVTKNPNDANFYIDDIKVHEKPILAPGVIFEESFTDLPGPHSADFTGYNGWWNGKTDATGRYFKKRMDTVVYVPKRVEHMIWVNHTNQYSALTWFVSPKISLKDALDPVLSFNFGIGNNDAKYNFLKIKITDEFEGGAVDPTQCIWEDITDATKIYDENVVTSYSTVQPLSFHNVKVDLSAYVGENVYVCFEYSMPAKDDKTKYMDSPVYYIDEFNVSEKGTSGSVPQVAMSNLIKVADGQLLFSDQIISAEIYSPIGKLIKTTTNKSIQVSDLSGVYLVRVTDKNQNYTFKVVL